MRLGNNHIVVLSLQTVEPSHPFNTGRHWKGIRVELSFAQHWAASRYVIINCLFAASWLTMKWRNLMRPCVQLQTWNVLRVGVVHVLRVDALSLARRVWTPLGHQLLTQVLAFLCIFIDIFNDLVFFVWAVSFFFNFFTTAFWFLAWWVKRWLFVWRMHYCLLAFIAF